jgi:hypothetical protein
MENTRWITTGSAAVQPAKVTPFDGVTEVRAPKKRRSRFF